LIKKQAWQPHNEFKVDNGAPSYVWAYINKWVYLKVCSVSSGMRFMAKTCGHCAINERAVHRAYAQWPKKHAANNYNTNVWHTH